MSFFFFFEVELKRIFQAKSTWLAIVLTVCAPLAGYIWYTPAIPETRASVLIANPVLAGGLAGAMFFAMLALHESSRVHKSGSAALTDTIVSPLTLAGARVLALMAPAAASVLLALIIYLPYTMLHMKNLFIPSLYIASFVLLMLPSLIFAILAADALYQITRRVDLGFVIFSVFVLLSLNQWVSDDFMLRWVNPMIPIFSDDFSNIRILRMALYNRMFWLLILLGAYLFSILCIRRYGKNILGSLRQNGRWVYLPILAALLLAGGYYTYIYQPYIDHSPIDYVEIEETYNEKMFLKNTNVDITLNTRKGTMQGKAVYDIENGNIKPQKCRFSINPGYKVKSVTANGRAILFADLNNDTNNAKEIEVTLPADPKLKLIIEYGGFPQEWSMSREYVWGDEISDRYVNLSSKSFSPQLGMLDKTDTIAITGTVTLPGDMMFIPTGKPALLVSENEDGTKTWRASDTGTKITFYAGDYVRQNINKAGMNIEFYYSRRHEDIMQKSKAKQTMEAVVEYCAQHYGSLPFDKQLPLKLIQSSAYQTGGGAYRNFSVMGETYFSEENLNDSQKGANSSEVLAHEITHQWWGLSASTIDEEPWSTEGLTVYTTYRMMKEKHGERYARKYYVDMWKSNLDALNRSFYRRHPEYLKVLPEKYAVMVSAQEWSTQMYDIMPLYILKGSELLGGEDKMDKVLAQLYQNGGTEMPPYITYKDFLKACGLTKEEISVD